MPEEPVGIGSLALLLESLSCARLASRVVGAAYSSRQHAMTTWRDLPSCVRWSLPPQGKLGHVMPRASSSTVPCIAGPLCTQAPPTQPVLGTFFSLLDVLMC